MFYKFSSLKELYYDMIERKETRCIFKLSYNGKPFSCIYIIDITPFRLYLDTFGEKPYSFEFEIVKPFSVKAFMSNDYYNKLTEYLGLKWEKGNPFSPTAFFNTLDTLIPRKFTKKPNYTEALKTISKHRQIEECEKIYFCGWRNNNTTRESVSPLNYEKTKSAFGEEKADICKRVNVSSKWTADRTKEDLSEFKRVFG